MIIKLILTGLIIAIQLVDGWTTYQIIRRGRGVEANPVVRWLIDRLGLYFGLLLAKSWCVAAVGIGWAYDAWAGDLGTGLLLGLAVFYLWVVMQNDRVLYGED